MCNSYLFDEKMVCSWPVVPWIKVSWDNSFTCPWHSGHNNLSFMHQCLGLDLGAVRVSSLDSYTRHEGAVWKHEKRCALFLVISSHPPLSWLGLWDLEQVVDVSWEWAFSRKYPFLSIPVCRYVHQDPKSTWSTELSRVDFLHFAWTALEPTILSISKSCFSSCRMWHTRHQVWMQNIYSSLLCIHKPSLLDQGLFSKLVPAVSPRPQLSACHANPLLPI